MSTRAGIIVKDASGQEIHFYRHSDGYPKGTMPTLRKFLNLVKKEQIRNNVSQAAGWLVLIGAKEYNHTSAKICSGCGTESIGNGYKHWKWSKSKSKYVCKKCGGIEYTFDLRKELPIETIFDPKKKEQLKSGYGWKVGAYELTSNVNVHGDLAYIYTINLETLTITYKEV